MQKWQYLFLVLSGADGKTFKISRINGDVQKNWQNGPEASHACNRLGDEGWEMVTATHEIQFDGDGNAHPIIRIFMKRPY